MHRNIICIVSIYEERATHNICGMVSKAKAISQNEKYKVYVIAFGNFINDEKSSLFRAGADKVIVFKENAPLKYDEVLKNLSFFEEISLIMFVDTEMEWAAKLATTVAAGLTADCIDIKNSSDNGFVFSRTAIGDTIVADIVCINSPMAICTIKHNVFSEQNIYPTEGEYVEIEDLDRRYVESDMLVTQRRKSEIQKKYDLDQAKIVFGIGRGVKGNDLKRVVERIAHKVGGVVVGTRAVVESGFIEKERQVGQSGVSISPDLYVAIGISGAIQHMIGIVGAKEIIAINHDKSAPIFQYADYCIIGDCNEILYELDKKIRNNI